MNSTRAGQARKGVGVCTAVRIGGRRDPLGTSPQEVSWQKLAAVSLYTFEFCVEMPCERRNTFHRVRR